MSLSDNQIMKPLYDMVKDTVYVDNKSYSCVKEFTVSTMLIIKPSEFVQDKLPPQWKAKKKQDRFCR